MILRLLAALWLPHGFISAETGLLYSTDFENFPAGANQWAGTEGWFSNAGSLGIQGIDQDQVAGIGNSAFLGFNTPALRWNYVARPFNHNPVTQGSASIEIDTLLGIQDSTNGNFDSFFVSIYNHLGQFLAAIQFTNEKQLYRIWRDNGVSLIDTTINFIPGELQLLFLRIDLINNRWSAEHDGIPLFTDQTFTMSENSRTFGSLSYEWQITDEEPANHGNNWMLVAGCEAWAIPPATKEVTVNPITFSETGEPGFEFDGEPGWTYQIEYTESFAGWNNDLPDSTFVITEQGTKVQFTDPSNRQPKTRFYRVLRTVTPQSRRITS